MSSYLQRMAASALKPGGAIHPILGSIFTASRDRRIAGDFQGEDHAPSRNWPEFPVVAPQGEGVPHEATPEFVTPAPLGRTPPSASLEPSPAVSEAPPVRTVTSAPDRAAQKGSAGSVPKERTSFKPLVNEGQQREVEKAAVRSVRMNDETGGLEEPKPVLSTKKSDLVTPSRDAPKMIQSAAPELDRSVESVTLPPPMRSISEGKNTLVTNAQQRSIEEPETVLKGRYKPLITEKFSRPDRPMIFPEVSAPLTPNVRKEERRELPRRAVPPQREPDEVQIHIGRIEVIAVPPAPAPPVSPKPRRGAPSLDEYLRDRDRRTV